MTDEKIKPIIGRMSEMWLAAHRLPAGLNLYPESSIAHAHEEGRQSGMREARQLDAADYAELQYWRESNRRTIDRKSHVTGMSDYEIICDLRQRAITRAAEGK